MIKEKIFTNNNSKDILKGELLGLLENKIADNSNGSAEGEETQARYLKWWEEAFGALKSGIDNNYFSPTLSTKIIYLLKDSLDSKNKSGLIKIDTEESEEIFKKAIEELS